MTETQALEDFIAAHGGDPVTVEPGVLLMPDGARVRLNGPMYYSPPTDPLKQARLRLQYATVRLADAQNAEKQFWSVSAHGGGEWRWDEKRLGPPPPEWVRLLTATRKDFDAEAGVKRRLGAIVAERRLAVAAAEAGLGKLAVPQPV